MPKNKGGEGDKISIIGKEIKPYATTGLVPSQVLGGKKKKRGGLNPVPGFSYKHAPPTTLKPIHAYNTTGLSPSQAGGKKKKGGVHIKDYPGESIVLQESQYNHRVPGGKKRGGTVPIPGTIQQLPYYNSSELYISQPKIASETGSSLLPFSKVLGGVSSSQISGLQVSRKKSSRKTSESVKRKIQDIEDKYKRENGKLLRQINLLEQTIKLNEENCLKAISKVYERLLVQKAIYEDKLKTKCPSKKKRKSSELSFHVGGKKI